MADGLASITRAIFNVRNDLRSNKAFAAFTIDPGEIMEFSVPSNKASSRRYNCLAMGFA